MNSNTKLIALFLAFASLATLAIGIIPKASADGPLTPDLLIKIYFDPTTESWALDTGEIDINDWPLSKDFVDRWNNDPDITLNEYAEIGKMEFDLNNQWWPTGPNDPTHSSAIARNIMFDETGVRDVAALHFRRAIAHLTNKAKYTTQYMQGMGYVMETEVPVPALAGNTDYSTLENDTYLPPPAGWPSFDRSDNSFADSGFLYEYDVDAAKREFEIGGFMDWNNGDGDGNPATGTREWSSDNGATYETLPNMKFWIRIDDPNRRQAGEDLFNEMVAAGIPAAAGTDQPGLEKIVTERSACFNNVMVLYKYNLYTGGWSLGSDMDFIFDLYHSSMGQYGYATNYAGFKNEDFDAYAAAVKYPVSLNDVEEAAINAQWVKAKYMPVVELWAAKAVKAYRTGWDGVVNVPGAGTDNGYTFLLANQTGRTDIKWGFKSDISALHVITSEWLWDWNVLGLMYDSLLGGNPYDLTEDTGAIAEEWSTTTTYPGWAGKTVAIFKVRQNATFHDGSEVKPADVAYSLLVVRDAGSGNAWNFPVVMDINKIEISGQTVRVFFNVQSAWAIHWAGFMPIINKDLWNQAIGDGTTADYNGGFIADDTDGTYTGGSFGNGAAIRDYHPWEVTTYGNAAVMDIAEDGSGPWKFVSHAAGQTVSLTKHGTYYPTIIRQGWESVSLPSMDWEKKNASVYKPIPIETFVSEAFHERGNVNFPGGYGENEGWYTSDEEVEILDLARIATALTGTAGSEPWPSANWGNAINDYNPDADANYDLVVNVVDLATAGLNFNKKQG